MIYRNLSHRIFLCSVLTIAMGGAAMSASAVTAVSEAAGANASVSGERQLRGDFIRLSDNRELVTSVGTFDVPANVRIIDHRKKDDELSAQTPLAALKFRNDSLIEVTIY
jgi:hypothetical protein